MGLIGWLWVFIFVVGVLFPIPMSILQLAGNSWTGKKKVVYVLKRLGNNIIVFLAWVWILLFTVFALQYTSDVSDVVRTMILFNRNSNDLVFIFSLIPGWYFLTIVLIDAIFMIVPLRGVIGYNDEEKKLMEYYERKGKIFIFSHFSNIFNRR
jgi:hypothetical protein